MTIRAITFDFWRTLFRDCVAKERFRCRAELIANATEIPLDRAKEIFKEVSERFLHHHILHQKTLGPKDAVAMIAKCLQRTFNADDETRLAHDIAQAILEWPPVPIDGAVEAVHAAAELLPVGVISDAGMSPSTLLKELLSQHDLLEPFAVLAFSDEVGVAKPQGRIFERAVSGLQVAPGELLHIGDLEPTDIAGARAFGARSALFAGDNDRFKDDTAADYTFFSWTEFVDALPSLASSR